MRPSVSSWPRVVEKNSIFAKSIVVLFFVFRVSPAIIPYMYIVDVASMMTIYIIRGVASNMSSTQHQIHQSTLLVILTLRK